MENNRIHLSVMIIHWLYIFTYACTYFDILFCTFHLFVNCLNSTSNTVAIIQVSKNLHESKLTYSAKCYQWLRYIHWLIVHVKVYCYKKIHEDLSLLVPREIKTEDSQTCQNIWFPKYCIIYILIKSLCNIV